MRKKIIWTVVCALVVAIGTEAYVHRAELEKVFKSFVCKLNGDDEKCSGADFLRRRESGRSA